MWANNTRQLNNNKRRRRGINRQFEMKKCMMITFNKKNSPSNKSIFIISSKVNGNDKSYISTNNNRNNTKVVAKKSKFSYIQTHTIATNIRII